MLEIFYNLIWVMASGVNIYVRNNCPTLSIVHFVGVILQQKSKRNKTQTCPLLRKALAQ